MFCQSRQSSRRGGVLPRPYADLVVWYKRSNSSKRTPLLLIRLAARATFPTWGRLFSAHRTLSRAPGNSKKGSQPLLGRSEVRQGEISSSQAPCPSPRRKRQVSLIALLVLSKLCPLRWDTIWFFSLGCLSLHHQRRCRKPFAPLARYGFGSLYCSFATRKKGGLSLPLLHRAA